MDASGDILNSIAEPNMLLTFFPKTKIELIVPDHMEETVIKAMIEAARTGNIGDGKIFVEPVEEVIRIRTGERGEEAI